jgi:hypothetical protein
MAAPTKRERKEADRPRVLPGAYNPETGGWGGGIRDDEERHGTCARCGDWIWEPGQDLCSQCDLGYEPGED